MTLPAATASAAVRPRRLRSSVKPLPAAPAPPKSVLVRLPPPRPAVPHRKSEPETVAEAMPKDPPVEAAPLPIPTREAPVMARPAQVRPAPARPRPSKADEDAEAERLQKFIWSEGR